MWCSSSGETRESPKKGKEQQAEHIKRGEPRGDQADDPEKQITIDAAGARESAAEDFIFAEEIRRAGACQRWPVWQSRKGETWREWCSRGRPFCAVLFAGERVNDAARAEEEQRFEEGVGHQVENASGKRADAEGEEHVAELADGGIRENFLDVVLHERHGGGENGGERADDGDDIHGDGRKLINGVHARNHVHAGGDHGGRVDQGADGRGAFHGVRQPNIERKLRGLAGGADEEEQRDGGERPARRKTKRPWSIMAASVWLMPAIGDGIGQALRSEADRAKGGGDEENAEQERPCHPHD